MRLHLFTLLAALAPYAFADVEITSPAAGASIPAGTITVSWKDSGIAPSISLLSTWTLTLMVGGNEGSTMLPLTSQTGTFATNPSSAQIVVDASKAGPTTNGFFWQMVSVATEGGTVTNYSPRFSVTGMTGSTPAGYTQAVTALGGSTAGPATVNNVGNNAAAGGSGAAAGAAQFTVPYNLQTGLTKYAPMQPVPPTKITANSFTPLFPTSSYVVATTYLGLPTIQTTITESQTFSVSSMENTVAAAAGPTGDMAKFLARWKD